MGTMKEDAKEIADALSELEVDTGVGADNRLHKTLLRALNDHADELGLTAEDVAEIEGEAHKGRETRGGEPKEFDAGGGE